MAYKDPEAKRASDHAYHAAHRVVRNAKSRAYHAAHREEQRAKKRLSRLENGPAINARRRAAQTQAQKTAKQRYMRAYGQRQRDKILAQKRDYQRAHPEGDRAHQQKRRAEKKGSPRNDLTRAQWCTIQEAQDHRCAYCGKRCKGHLTQDHITPLSKGGAHTLHNVIGACRACNLKKHAGPPLSPVQPLLL